MSWWDDVFYKLFASPQGQASWRGAVSGIPGIGLLSGVGQGAQRMGPFELHPKSEWKGPLPEQPSASPSPSATPTQSSPSPTPTASPSSSPTSTGSAKSDVQQAASLLAGQRTNPLYPGIPSGVNVFMGWQTKSAAKPETDMLSRYGRSGYHNEPNWVGLQEVIAQVNDWGPKEIARFNKLAAAAIPNWKPTNNLDKIADVWTSVAVRTAMMNQRGHMLTPWQLLGRYASGEIKKPGGQPRTVTSTSVNLTDTPTAKAAINDALSAVLGRGATKAEKAKFAAALRAAEEKNPTVTTTTTNAGGTSVSSTTKQGLNPSTFAQDYALEHNTAEAQAYQAVTTYMNAFFSALSAPV